MVNDGPAKIFLNNKVAKMGDRLNEIRTDIAGKTRELEGLKNLYDAYVSNPSHGNSDDINESILDVKRALTIMENEKLRYDTFLDVIKSAVGDVSDGKRHNLSKSHFPIPTTCDYCQDKIWGITQQGMTCKGIPVLYIYISNLLDCGYNCHAKCEMKVPPYCTETKYVRPKRISSSPASTMISSTKGSINESVAISTPYVAATAIYDYEPINPDELAIKVGDSLQIIAPDDGSGWIKVNAIDINCDSSSLRRV